MLKASADLAHSDQEWGDFLATNDFGQLIAVGVGRQVPVVTPTHFIFDGHHTIECHLHRRNPVFAALEESHHAVLSVIGAHVYIPTSWNAEEGEDPRWSAPTSYYAAVQATAISEIIDDTVELADLINRQLQHFQPEGGFHPVRADGSPFGRMLSGIRGIRLTLDGVEAKFKFGGNRTEDHRYRIAEQLTLRNSPRDSEARSHLLRRTIRTSGPTSEN